MVLRDDVSTLEMFVWLLSHVSRSINLVSVHTKSMKHGQITNLRVIFHVVVSVY